MNSFGVRLRHAWLLAAALALVLGLAACGGSDSTSSSYGNDYNGSPRRRAFGSAGARRR